jgi:hypothetical protein
MRKFLTIIYGSLSLSYLIKQYVFGGIMYALMLYANGASPIHKTGVFIFLTLSLVLYPFAMFVYDSIVDTLIGNWIVPVPAVLLLIWLPIKIVLIFMFAVLIAPIGMLYLYITGRRGYTVD